MEDTKKEKKTGRSFLRKEPGTKRSRMITSIVSVVWCLGSLIFFNYFREYIAYYHDGIREALVTPDVMIWLWVHNPMLILSVIAYSVFLFYERYVLRESVTVFLAVLGLASTSVLLAVFPFDFSVMPDGMAGWIGTGLRVALILTIVMTAWDAVTGGYTLIGNLKNGIKEY